VSAGVERVPPQNLDAEQSVLGSMLIDGDAIARVMDLLGPDDFYREAHRSVFEAVVSLYDRGEPVDLVTVTEELRTRGVLDDVGGASYIMSLANAVPTSANVEYYARIVEEKAVLRRLVKTATAIVARAYEGKDDLEVLLDEAEQAVFAISQGIRGKQYASLREILTETFEHIEYIYVNKGKAIGVPTGFRDLDQLTSGLQRSELAVLAARPSEGKSTLALNVARNAALEYDVPVGVFSLEMSKEQVAQRLLCSEARVDGHRLRTGYLSDDDWPKLSRALGRLSEAPIYIDDTPNLSIMELRARARRMKAEHDIGLLIVDYLQLMHTRGRAENRQQEISEITRSLKALARELSVPILALSQLSRAVEQRQDRRPQLSDLRESGAIEQDADLVAFIYRDPKRHEGSEIEIIVAKQRNGPTDTVQMVFRRNYGRFDDISKRRPPGGAEVRL